MLPPIRSPWQRKRNEEDGGGKGKWGRGGLNGGNWFVIMQNRVDHFRLINGIQGRV